MKSLKSLSRAAHDHEVLHITLEVSTLRTWCRRKGQNQKLLFSLSVAWLEVTLSWLFSEGIIDHVLFASNVFPPYHYTRGPPF